MRHFHRCSLSPDAVLEQADRFFGALGLTRGGADARSRTFGGTLGTVKLSVKMEGGHYTFVEVHTDQVGESRIDKNVKKYFNALHRAADPRHSITAGY
ncbi:hypothetical protein [Gemmatimonas phototrophica]|uniref:Uncharacterized protein n=1 Tax=Gemmatimonas phototrophica TaxID=1379270 RepID=A0A143BKK3_9BACT|nr:hypothetical protein [Gemmatimonas phototrophica]AMW05115.1 hypothetical protein GEMMAAP_10365 [Gemmatimonas phototrophica]